MDENSKRIASIEDAFGTSGIRINIQGRTLIGEGTLMKMCRRKLKNRQFFLFNDILIYGTVLIPNIKYTSQHILFLDSIKVEDYSSDGSSNNGFIIKSPKKSFTVYTYTADEKVQWMAFIKKYSLECLEKNGGEKKQAFEVSPVWIPDGATNTCLHCHKTEFSLINRRHHCRKCGIVVCGRCSEQRWLLPGQSSEPLRVCNTCFTVLKSGGGDGSKPDQASKSGPLAATTTGPSNDHFMPDSDFSSSSSSDDEYGSDAASYLGTAAPPNHNQDTSGENFGFRPTSLFFRGDQSKVMRSN